MTNWKSIENLASGKKPKSRWPVFVVLITLLMAFALLSKEEAPAEGEALVIKADTAKPNDNGLVVLNVSTQTSTVKTISKMPIIQKAPLVDDAIKEVSEKALSKIYKAKPTSKEGRIASLQLADLWWGKYVLENIKFEKWAMIRNAYSNSLPIASKRATDVRVRLMKLNKYLVFSKAKCPRSIVHIVKSGESLSRIANKYGVTRHSISLINSISNPNKIRPKQKLKILPGKSFIFVSKKDFRLDLYLDDIFIKSYPIAIGLEDKTVPGTYVVGKCEVNPSWSTPDGRLLPFGHKENILGTRWIGFDGSPNSNGLGIHGTAKPESIGTKASAGCVRMRNADVNELFVWVHGGDKVTIVD